SKVQQHRSWIPSSLSKGRARVRGVMSSMTLAFSCTEGLGPASSRRTVGRKEDLFFQVAEVFFNCQVLLRALFIVPFESCGKRGHSMHPVFGAATRADQMAGR